MLATAGSGRMLLKCHVADLFSKRLHSLGGFRKSAILLMRFACSESVRFCGKLFGSNVVTLAVVMEF